MHGGIRRLSKVCIMQHQGTLRMRCCIVLRRRNSPDSHTIILTSPRYDSIPIALPLSTGVMTQRAGNALPLDDPAQGHSLDEDTKIYVRIADCGGLCQLGGCWHPRIENHTSWTMRASRSVRAADMCGVRLSSTMAWPHCG